MARAFLPFVAVGIVCAALCAAGCDSSGAPTPARPAAATVPILRVATWTVTGGRLSILVRNDGTVAVGSARAVITARDVHGNAVATLSGVQCCTVAGLAPKRVAGIYADLGAAARRVTRVVVRWADVRRGPAAVPQQVSVADVSLQTGRATTVAAVLTSQASASAVMTGQAVLRGADGQLVGVLTGVPTCLHPGVARTVELRLGLRLPAGTVLGSFDTYPVPDGRC